MTDAPLGRLLRRRGDVTVAELTPGRPAVVRRDELLVAGRDASDVESRARRWIDRVETDDDATITRFRLRPDRGVPVAELAAELSRDSRHRIRSVTPNHLMVGCPGAWGGGPADRPSPVHDAPAPPRAPAPRPAAREAARAMTVVVLDTGVSAHPWFESRPWFAEVRPQDHEVLDALPQDDVLDAQAGHGTFIAGILTTDAPEADLLTPRILASDGVCDEYDVVRRLRRLRRWSLARQRPVDVLNLSFGGYTVDDEPSPLVADAINAFGRGTVVVACAGNAGSSRLFWPAALKPVIAVGALDHDGDDRAAFSNYGWWVDACAVGEQVVSSFVTFDDAFTGYARWSGTSFAAPRVAAAIAATAAELAIPARQAADLVLDPDATRSMPDLGVVVTA